MRGYDSRPETYEHIAEVRGLMMNVAVMLLRAAHAHDASKLVAPEVEVFDEFTPKLRDTTYGSPEYKEFLEGMGAGLRHHYAANRHHPEHFSEGIAAMDLLDVLEMLCDWIAATKRHADGDIRRSIEQNQERFGYGDEIKRLLSNTVDRLEEASFVEAGPEQPDRAEPWWRLVERYVEHHPGFRIHDRSREEKKR